ncbi:ty transcription activator TEC1 [Clostridium sp. E02]|uniref:ty transcription activator TEC1 n=1 Tax=Clostridium sp. E02 TaxID=2487134 RepID=UPI000F544C0D|nr:ty transcription activator TEC1 [Clostridium sp. E02]
MKGNFKKNRIHFTLFGTLVLVLLLVLIFLTLKGKADPIFDQNSTTTFYLKTDVGQIPKLEAERYFNPETYDTKKFQFDLSHCDWNVIGIYRVPVMYDGEKTNCMVQIQVRNPKEKDAIETVPDRNQNEVLSELEQE